MLHYTCSCMKKSCLLISPLRDHKGTLACIAATASLVAPLCAQAATATDTMAVTATVQSACAVTATGMAFGSYDPTVLTNHDATTTIQVNCTSGTSYTVGLSAGLATGATVSARKMVNGSNLLPYSLYRDASRTQNWGNTAGVDSTSATVATSTPATLTVYGRIAGLQNVPAGNYSDTVTVTVTY